MNKVFKVLYVDVYRHYHNPNNANFLKVLQKSSRLTKYGPGFTDKEVLDKGITNFIDNNKGFDFIVTEHMCIMWDEKDPLKAFKNSTLEVDLGICSAFLEDIKDYFVNNHNQKIKKLFFCNFDPYNISIKNIELLEKSKCYLITKDHKFWYQSNELENLIFEDFNDKVNDNWFKFISLPSTKKKVISYHTALDKNEFCSKRFIKRKYDISIPGVEYHSRKIASRELKLSNYAFKIGKKSSGLRRKIISRLMQITKSKTILRYYQDSYSKGINDSKTCFTCGSALMYTIRKFYEIPARGSLLLCEPLEPLKHLGFENKDNCIFVSLEDLDKKLYEIINDKSNIFQKVADNGREMMFSLHSIETRAHQLYKMMLSIDQERFNGSEFLAGHLNIHEK